MFADKVQEAWDAVDEARNGWFTSAEFDVRLDALVAAVREDERERLKRSVWWFDGGVCHLSSCPANCLLEGEDEAYFCDCGLAKFEEAIRNA